MLDAGGSRQLVQVGGRVRLAGDGALRLPLVLLPGLDAWQLAFGLTGSGVLQNGLGATIGLHPDVRFADDSSGTKVAIGAALGARPGYYARRWSAALDLLWSTAVATHMSHSEAVKDTFRDRYPDGRAGDGPEDGWFAFSSHRLRLGVAGGLAAAPWLAFHGSAGFAYTPQVGGILANPPISPMPFYANVGGAYRW
jgi:hypothetical protein